MVYIRDVGRRYCTFRLLKPDAREKYLLLYPLGISIFDSTSLSTLIFSAAGFAT